jgi:hypothetical protein
MSRNPSARSLNRGHSVEDEQVEEGMYSWFLELSSKEIQVKTKMFVQRAIQSHPTFHDGDTKKLKNWVYKFLDRYKMSIRRITHKGQKLRSHLLDVRDDTAASIRSRFAEGGSLHGVELRNFVNMDETAVYFESKSNTTVSRRGVKTVPERDSGSNAKRCTVCVAVAADGTKLPLFFVFKGSPNARIEERIRKAGILGTVQPAGWMDERATKMWFEQVWCPYVQGHPRSLLLLDHFSCHMQEKLHRRLARVGTEVELIPGGYTSVLQPVDVGVAAPLKRHIEAHHNTWCIETYPNYESGTFPTPTIEEVHSWTQRAWDEIKSTSIAKTFASIGLRCPVPIEEV